jgi:secondary thiamine-phosphate synthase enzyme
MATNRQTLKRKTQGNCDIADLTEELEAAVAASGIRDGIASVFVVGSTAAVTTVEYERGLVRDLKDFFERVVPESHRYAHNHGGESNGHAHVRASLVGPSISVPLVDGRLALGTWQQVVLIDFDDRPRQREVIVQVVGD